MQSPRPPTPPRLPFAGMSLAAPPPPRRDSPGSDTAAKRPSLPAALAHLGDQASRLIPTVPDPRLHILACQAHHLAAEIEELPGWPPTPGQSAPGRGLAGSGRAVRRALTGPLPQPLPLPLMRDVMRLLQLCEAAAP